MSLRARLMVIILIPLALTCLAAGYWRITSASETAREVFDLKAPIHVEVPAVGVYCSRDIRHPPDRQVIAEVERQNVHHDRGEVLTCIHQV